MRGEIGNLAALRTTVAAALLTLLVSAVLAAGLAAQSGSAPDPFAFFHPAITVNVSDRARLDAGEVLVRVAPHGPGREIAIFSAARVNVDADRVVAWMRRIAELKQSPYVRAIGRFSQPPRIEDLATLDLEDKDLEDIRQCRPGDCGVKLSGREIEQLRQTIAHAGSTWKGAVQDEFRRLVLARAQSYLESGHAATPPYHDQRTPVSLGAEFAALIEQSRFLTARLPQLAEYLKQYPDGPLAPAESFLYWSKEVLAGRPIVSVTHVTIIRGVQATLPQALVAGKQIFANHYMTGSLGITALIGADAGGPRYLAYLNRSHVDLLGGVFGGLVRRIMERRLRTEAAEVVQGLRRRLESGDPPS